MLGKAKAKATAAKEIAKDKVSPPSKRCDLSQQYFVHANPRCVRQARSLEARASASTARESTTTHEPEVEDGGEVSPPAFTDGGHEKEALPQGWEQAVSRSTGDTCAALPHPPQCAPTTGHSARRYYINQLTGESSYDYPTAPATDEVGLGMPSSPFIIGESVMFQGDAEGADEPATIVNIRRPQTFICL